jgi:hypothetical protein
MQQAYVDDHTLINSSTAGAQYNLDLLDVVLKWSNCLVLKTQKCFSLGLGDKRWMSGPNEGLSFGPFDPELKSKVN